MPRITFPNLDYAGDGIVAHRLDLHVPDDYLTRPPLATVVWIHGGGWQSGDKSSWTPAQHLVDRGYAVASINYRLTSPPDSSIHPAQIHDVKAAVRWLRGNATSYNLAPNRFGTSGSSAGGHLAALLGTSGGVAALEGTVGTYLNQSSRVRAVVDFFGPSDLYAIWQVPGYEAHGGPSSPGSRLIGATLRDNPQLAALASPTTYATVCDPAFLIFHGTGAGNGDGTVPWQQSQLMHNAMQAVGSSSTLHLVPGAGHSYSSIVSNLPDTPQRVATFLDQRLRARTAVSSCRPTFGSGLGPGQDLISWSYEHGPVNEQYREAETVRTPGPWALPLPDNEQSLFTVQFVMQATNDASALSEGGTTRAIDLAFDADVGWMEDWNDVWPDNGHQGYTPP